MTENETPVQESKETEQRKELKILVTKDMTISDVVQKYPEAAEVFMDYGLHCIGCHISGFETLEQGSRGHGMDDETIARMVEDANKIANIVEKAEESAPKVDPATITITDAAVEKIKDGMKKNNKTGNFRIAILPDGASGLSYHFVFDEKKHSDDTVIEKPGLTVVIDHRSMLMMEGAKIDYVETPQMTGFKITNPKAKAAAKGGEDHDKHIS